MAVSGATKDYLIIGPCGSGRTTALKAFRDLDFVTLAGVEMPQVAALFRSLNGQGKPVALGLSLNPLNTTRDEFTQWLMQLKTDFPELCIFYLSTPQDLILQRYAGMEVVHPYEALLSSGQSLAQVLASEQDIFQGIKLLSDYHVDTSSTTPRELVHKVAKVLNRFVGVPPLSVQIVSFGFKNGAPSDCDLIFDVRFLPNPFYEPELRPYSGLDKPVNDYVMAFPESQTFLTYWKQLIGHTLPLYQQQGRTRVAIGVGCTGGQHRSVALAQQLGDWLQNEFKDMTVQVVHREQANWPEVATKPSGNKGTKPSSLVL